jgi:cytochrome c biogenesis protein CcdA/thiol-disulfide isomerase/thioredoxin
MLEATLAFGAGVATVGSPCVLPVLPILLGASTLQGGRHRPLFVTLGFVLTFSAVVLAFAATTRVFGLSQDALRAVGIAVLVVLGIVLLVPARVGRGLLGFMGDMALRWGDRAGDGPWGGLVLGSSLGLLWTPCAGPVLASILALAATQPLGDAAPLLLAYAVGSGVPMLAIAYGGQALVGRVSAVTRYAGALRRVFGVLVLCTAAAMHWHVDAQVAAWVSQAWAAPGSGAPAPATGAATAAPDFDGITQWLNGPPLTIGELRGKVVLLDFWTFGCVNCLNTLPHIKAWHARFRDQGLVVVGVQTPEFAFEREPANVANAVRRLGVEYTVALDPQFRTWNRWHVAAWPTVILLDRQGRTVFRHVGEGAEVRIEAAILQALTTPGPPRAN